MIKLAESEPNVAVNVDDLDADPYLLGARDEVLDLRTEQPTVTEDVITKTIAVRFDPAAECTRWLRFLDQIFDGNEDLISYVQRAIGYSLTGSVEEQCLFFLHGKGANGKSTFINVIRHLLGDYAIVAPSTAFMSSKNPDNPAIAALQGARMVLASEVGEYRRFNETIVKQITGGDKITARFLYQGYFEYTPMFKVWIAGNHLPNVRGTDHAIWRRFKLIPFTVTIPEDGRDPKMEEKLKLELPGILNWALKGTQQWLEGGLQEPECVTEATAQYRSSMDILGAWIEDQCECEPTQSCSAKSLYSSYKHWAENSGEWVMTKRKFGLKLPERGFEGYKSSGVRHYKGISVKHEFYSMNG
jgi:putative DNA primase/helicase